MAQWEVIASKIELLSHPNSDNMLIGKVGMFQVVVAKSNGYKDGDVIIFAPERAELPDSLKGNYVNSQTGISYLVGPRNNRVKQVRLRGELSEGVTIPAEWVLENFPQWRTINDIPLDTDLSQILGITKYEPPIPASMGGIVKGLDGIDFGAPFIKHDVEQFRLHSREFVEGEPVVLTEKVHGSQINIIKNVANVFAVTSKGFGSKGLVIEESPTNLYWIAFNNCGIRNLLAEKLDGRDVQLVGEVVPCQGGFTYGQQKPTIRFFRIVIGGQEITRQQLEQLGLQFLAGLWVPVIYEGPFVIDDLIPYAEGKEQVSGKELHIREGVVVRPSIPRRAMRGSFDLQLKLINSKYKAKDDDLS